jgi:hypothetical protein
MTNVATLSESDIPVEEMIRGIAKDAQAASHALGLVESETRSDALRQGAAAIRERMPDILTANAKDMAFGREKGRSYAVARKACTLPAPSPPVCKKACGAPDCRKVGFKPSRPETGRQWARC